MKKSIITETEQLKCPYCGTIPVKNVRTHRTVCACRRMHEYKDFNGKKYLVLYMKDGTREIIKNGKINKQ